VNVGLGYAISINQIKNFLGHLRSGRIVDHATLGATVAVNSDGRIVVSNILESSDAFRRGLRYGDEVLRFGGRQIRSVNGFKNVLGIYPRGWRVPLTCSRDGEQHELFVRLAGLHARGELTDLVQKRSDKPRQPPKPRPIPGRDPGKQPGDPKKKPDPPHGPKAPVIPVEVAKFIKKKMGYANYYFNQQNLQRVWDGCRTGGDFSKVAGVWNLTGHGTNAEEMKFELGHGNSFATVPAGRSSVVMGTDFSEQLGPAGSGGLLAALHIWRRVLIEGPSNIGDAYYLGTQPLRGHDGLYDVIVATFDVVELQLSFEPASGRLMALEMFPELGEDPCEIYFDDYRDVAGRQVPHRMLVWHGDGIFAEIEFVDIELAVAKEET
jgi:hypothetical protein